MIGMQVTLQYKDLEGERIFHNVTEVHYYVAEDGRINVAFESDIHSTGINLDVERHVKEFRVEEELSICEGFID